jgi:glycine/D-amino acid oxidase-like deaminating enzyme
MIGGHARTALASAEPAVFWSDRPYAPEQAPQLVGSISADLTIIGGGFTGLWTAIQALEDDGELRVVLVEAERCGFGASSRNGGICDASLTHGLENGLSHWPEEIETLVKMGSENLDAIEGAVHRYGIEADFRRTAEVGVATEPWHLESMVEDVDAHRRVGHDASLLDANQMRELLDSPTYLGGIIVRDDVALVDPARLCWGLRGAAEGLGASVFERSAVEAIEPDGAGLAVHTAKATVHSRRVVVATNAYRAPIKKPSRYVIPVYDHVLMTEPLSHAQMMSIGWGGREGVGDVSNQFHYYRLSGDDRILWGGYDATYHFGSGVDPGHDQSDETHGMLAEHFFETFPQLEGLRFTHRWGGPIGTTSRFTATWGTAHDGKLAWAAGYTGLGVGASRFGARVALDLVFGQRTSRTELEMVRKNPFPFPPEPLRWTGVQLTRKAIQRADRREGKRGAWLALLDRFGIGFDS